MKKNTVHFYHIAYSEETWRSAPVGIQILDNRHNERPDWAEYWPIRRFLLNETLDESAFYAFLSPSFAQKTLTQPLEFAEFVAGLDSSIEIATCSPYYDMRTIFRNVFEQGEFTHTGFIDLSREVLAHVRPDLDVSQMIHTGYTAVFANYFAAKPRFWRAWLELGERLFAMAESPTHPCAAGLNRPFNYKNPPFQFKVFLVERLASLLLASPPGFVMTKYGRETLSTAWDGIPFEMFETLDMLKTLGMQGKPQLLRAFAHIQRELLQEPAIQQWKRDRIASDRARGMFHPPSKGYETWVTDYVDHKNDSSSSNSVAGSGGMGQWMRKVWGRG